MAMTNAERQAAYRQRREREADERMKEILECGYGGIAVHFLAGGFTGYLLNKKKAKIPSTMVNPPVASIGMLIDILTVTAWKSRQSDM